MSRLSRAGRAATSCSCESEFFLFRRPELCLEWRLLDHTLEPSFGNAGRLSAAEGARGGLGGGTASCGTASRRSLSSPYGSPLLWCSLRRTAAALSAPPPRGLSSAGSAWGPMRSLTSEVTWDPCKIHSRSADVSPDSATIALCPLEVSANAGGSHSASSRPGPVDSEGAPPAQASEARQEMAPLHTSARAWPSPDWGPLPTAPRAACIFDSLGSVRRKRARRWRKARSREATHSSASLTTSACCSASHALDTRARYSMSTRWDFIFVPRTFSTCTAASAPAGS
mmetsp:Transcript_10713/g.29983  ORF Transcript_10713/g.29983 Transcript_10713/m.29983 type:complete len:284 (-) Transcript_10713:30-881(-)